jgi:hypothetical protein
VIKDDPQEIVIPLKRQIGFNREEMQKKSSSLFQPNIKAREKAVQTAKQLSEDLGRIPTTKELMEQGLTEHYSRLARKEIESA